MDFLFVVLALSGLFVQSDHGDTCDADDVMKCAKQISDAAVKVERKRLDASKEDKQEFCREAKRSATCLENFFDKCQRYGSEGIKDMIMPRTEWIQRECAEFDGAVSIRFLAPVLLLLVNLIPLLGMFVAF